MLHREIVRWEERNRMPIASRAVLTLALVAIPVATSVGGSPQTPALARASFA